jgi:hypothetical protein
VTRQGLVFEQPKTRRSRRTVVLPAFLRPYLDRQREDQARRREEAGEAWCENDLVIDRGDGSPLNPDTLSSGWWGSFGGPGSPTSGSTIFATPTPRLDRHHPRYLLPRAAGHAAGGGGRLRRDVPLGGWPPDTLGPGATEDSARADADNEDASPFLREFGKGFCPAALSSLAAR